MNGIVFLRYLEILADQFPNSWLKSPAFGTWLAQQEQIVQNVLNDSPASAGSAR
jgi:hypothetical protein